MPPSTLPLPTPKIVAQQFFLDPKACILIGITALYLILVRCLRYRRANSIASPFTEGKRPMSSMTTQEASDIMTQLQSFEFPYSMNKARSVALLKAGGIPTMSKLFAVTGQNNVRNAGKRAVDTEILLRESQTQPRNSQRYMDAVARMNYLHARYRKAGKILDKDLLHTLGDGALEILHVIDSGEWRQLSPVEKCAVGVFHYNLGEDLEIPFTPLRSSESGWQDGLHFVTELIEWTKLYEKEVARPTATGDQYVRVYVDSAGKKLGKAVTSLLRQLVGLDLDDTMRESLCIEAAGPLLSALVTAITNARKLALRHLSLPRPASCAYQPVSSGLNTDGLYNFSHGGFQPWYIQPSFWSIWSPGSLLLRTFGARKPGSKGDRYRPRGYDLKTIGPSPQEGKGIEEMTETVAAWEGRGTGESPFGDIQKRKRYASTIE
ncbi:hypothetical protein BU24DRAFT_369172 [Aaosphaeria arxii CBS 175.79]|uniref:ER-bound oxygenase mpaB/mpaB'/Rubber oxygenase catalytic domain-containing protein n=1 Tax=Aaosphaeria arxii CBS 175.79 TaxID=1450172 RepID=A0A6A5XQY1_9PLEO|nr:uncharacterized protein BU24DRAFT_369172 [Aaosphaeria arxii CBS 175.79]KAF2015247.1 hypothetical protein BU24DRAFT_369172 [Aaosphaeria arxii CBS 175.79]